jgi:steroid delta-isomerase-like uncharacterized protein
VSTALDTRALLKQYAAAVNAHDIDRIAALFDESGLVTDYVQAQIRSIWNEPGPQLGPRSWPRGLQAIERYYGEWFTAVPDLRLILYGMVTGPEGAALEMTIQGTHRGPLLGVPGRGNRIGLQVASHFGFLNGKIHDQRLYYDLATLQRQMGGEVPLGDVAQAGTR